MTQIHSELGGFPPYLDLKRIEPDLNVWRYYRMTIQRDLFGRTSLVREWGRIGCQGQVLIDTHEDVDVAASEMKRLASQKLKRGYATVTKGHPHFWLDSI